jgi:hypothetical protein
MADKFDMAVYRKSELARHVAALARHVSAMNVELAEGMWNPMFCESDGRVEAIRFLEDVEMVIRHVRNRLSLTSSDECIAR